MVNKEFFLQETVKVAKELLGCYILHDSPEGRIIGKIVETEAYLEKDPASHSFKGKTKRNQMMFGPAGKVYIYFTYGMYYCFNIVTEKEGVGEAVLIRALEPLEGIELMKKRRKKEDIYQLCNGPAKLVLALGIDLTHQETDLLAEESKLKLLPKKKEKIEIVTAKRIGISKATEEKLRFYIKDNKFVSKEK